MNNADVRDAVRDTVVDDLLKQYPSMLSINGKPYSFLVPVVVDGKSYCAKVGVTSYSQPIDKSTTNLSSVVVPLERATRKLIKSIPLEVKTARKEVIASANNFS